MNNLVNIIGLSPSEMPLDEYIEKVLTPERERVRKALENFRETYVPSSKKKAASKTKSKSKPQTVSKAALARLMKKHGLSIEELTALMEEQNGGDEGLPK